MVSEVQKLQKKYEQAIKVMLEETNQQSRKKIRSLGLNWRAFFSQTIVL